MGVTTGVAVGGFGVAEAVGVAVGLLVGVGARGVGVDVGETLQELEVSCPVLALNASSVLS